MDFLQAYDQGMLYWFQSLHRPWLDWLVVDVTHLGNAETLIVMVLQATVGLLVARQHRSAAVLLVAALLGLGVCEGIKELVSRVRPDVVPKLIPRPATYSFPSGHSMNSMAIYGSIGLILARHVRRRSLRALVLVFEFGLALAVGTSRVYLGVHWPTDVLAGWTGGLIVALLASWADESWGNPAAPPVPADKTLLTG